MQLRTALILLVCSLFAVRNVRAQATAQMSGTVRDQSGAVLPGVELSVTRIMQFALKYVF